MSHDHDEKDAKGELLPEPSFTTVGQMCSVGSGELRMITVEGVPVWNESAVRRIVGEAVTKEREACAALMENLRDTSDVLGETESADAFDTAATAIRARSTQPAPPSPTATDVSQYSKPDRAPGEDGFTYG